MLPENFMLPLALQQTAGIHALEATLTALPWSADALTLGRALADYKDQRGWTDQAYALYRHLLQRAADDPHAQAELQLDLAAMGARWKDIPALQAYLEQARPACLEGGSWRLAARYHETAAFLCLAQENPGAARQAAQRAVDLYTRHADWPGQANALVMLSFVLSSARLYDAAYAITQQLLSGDLRRMPARTRILLYHTHAAALNGPDGDAEKALSFYQRAWELAWERLDPRDAAACAENMIDLYRKQQCPELAAALAARVDALFAPLEDGICKQAWRQARAAVAAGG